MVFGVVTGDGDVMVPFTFAHALTHNTKANIKCLAEVVFPCTVMEVTGRSYV